MNKKAKNIENLDINSESLKMAASLTTAANLHLL